MMPTRPANLYVVFGWQVGEKERNVVLFEKGEEAMGLGVSLTISANGKKYFIGSHLATVKATDGEDYVGRALPGQQEGRELRQKMESLGINVVDDPMLYVVIG